MIIIQEDPRVRRRVDRLPLLDSGQLCNFLKLGSDNEILFKLLKFEKSVETKKEAQLTSSDTLIFPPPWVKIILL